MQQTTMIPNSGIMSVPQIAAASYAVSSPEVTNVSSGETVSGVYIGPDETMFIYSGGVASNIIASGIYPADITNGRATVVVSSGGKVIGAKIYLKATLGVKHGYVQSATAESGGSIALNGASGSVLSAVNSGTVNINSESFVSRCVAAGGGVIQNNGEIVDAIISSGGSMEVVGSRYMAYATNVFISRGGVVSAGSSSYLSNVYCTGTLNLGYGADAGTVYVYGGGNLQIAENVDARRVTVKAVGALNGFTRLSEEYYDSCSFNGLYHEDTYVSSGVTAILSNTHSAFNTQIRGGGVMVVNGGGMANYTRVAAGGSVIVSYGGTASRTTINGSNTKDTTMTVYSGGKAIGVTMSDARMLVEGTASNVTLQNAGIMIISSGGRAENIAVDTFGHLTINKYATAANVHISATGFLNGFSFRKETTYQNLGWVIDYVSTKVVGDVVLSSGCTAADTIINTQGKLTVLSGAKIIGPLEIQGNGKVRIENGGIVDLDISNRSPENAVLLKGWDGLTLVDPDNAITLTVNASDQQTGNYKLATRFYTSPEDFVISVVNTENTQLGTLTIGGNIDLGNKNFSLYVENNQLLLSVTEIANPKPASDLLTNGHSQIVAWDASKGNVGYVAVNGTIPPDWHGIWEWPQDEAAMWKVVGVGRFSGSTVEQDGILLYNGYGNTFAAWTNLNDPSYGYVSLCHVDGSFATKSLVNLDGNEFDDVLIYDEKGSFGVVTDAAEYHDIWHVDNPAANVQQLIGAGNFGAADGKDSLLVRKTDENAYFLWHNNDPSFNTWNWSQTYIGSLDDDWNVAGIGDFSGDGIDDIAMWRRSTGEIQIWEDGQASNQHYAGSLDQSSWEVAAVGDYNGDGMEDLLLRELATGWGGLGYWASANATKWTDLNARVETDMESRFAIIA